MADITRWEPFSELTTVRDAMDALFDQALVRRPRSLLTAMGESLAVDMYETENEVVVKATVPGVKPEDIDVSVVGDTLTIKGETKEEENVERQNYIRRERRYGRFSRTLSLPSHVNTSKAEAEFEDGVLTLTLPKAEEAKAKTITVKSKK